MNQKGFSLVTVLVLSLVIFLIGGTGLYIASTNFRATRADVNLNVAEKAANAGMLSAFDMINRTGTGGNDQVISVAGLLNYDQHIMFGGRNVWFLSSTGYESAAKKAKVVKTAMFQGYYGAALYTVRGNVNANLGTTRLSGCDASPNPPCYVPAFIYSGSINAASTPQSCSAPGASDGTTKGLFGEPASLKLDQGDLSRIFFRVQCFNRFNKADCTLSLLDYLQYDYGRHPTNPAVYDFSFQQDSAGATPANGWGIPIVTLTAPPANPPAVAASCQITASNSNVNLANIMTTCTQIVINTGVTNVSFSGSGDRSGVPVQIYAGDPASKVTFGSTAGHFTFYTKGSTVVNGSAHFTIISSGKNEMNTGTTNFELYTSGPTLLKGTIGTAMMTATPTFRIVSTNKITTGAGAVLNNGTIVTGPTSAADTNSLTTAVQNLETEGHLVINFVNLFARQIKVGGSGSTLRVLNSLVYVYAFACPDCSRADSNIGSVKSSFGACLKEAGWCGLYGNNLCLILGRVATGVPPPTLFISNNSTLYAEKSTETYIWGVWYGEDVTYLSTTQVNFNGFLVRNFPPNLSLNISLGGNFSMNFSIDIINTIANRYRFFRPVSCVRNPVTPAAQLIQTRMTNY
jgi:outer membrane murein-binding lipoprotein Lpp